MVYITRIAEEKILNFSSDDMDLASCKRQFGSCTPIDASAKGLHNKCFSKGIA